jgi:hypothetical protein
METISKNKLKISRKQAKVGKMPLRCYLRILFISEN